MKRLACLGSLLLLIVVAGHSAFAHGAAPVQQLSFARVASVREDSIKPANLGSYYVGYNLTFARYLALVGPTQDVVEYLKVLSRALSAQDQAKMESCLQMIASGQGTREQIDEMLKEVELNLEAKLFGEIRWFYNVGKTYAQFFITLDYLRQTNDARPVRQVLAKLGQLAQAAPADAPIRVVSSLKDLGEIGAKAEINTQDVAAIKKSVETIDTAMVV